MTNLSIEIEKGKRLELHLHDALFFVGGNTSWKNKLIQAFNAKTYRGKLNDLEKTSINHDLEITYKGKVINNKNTRLISLASPQDLINELSLERKSLIYDNVLAFQEDIEVVQYIETLNDVILSLEAYLSEFSDQMSTRLDITMDNLSYGKLIQSFAHVSYNAQYVEESVSTISIERLIQPFLDLMAEHIKRTGETVWIILDGFDRYISDEYFIKLMDGFNALYEEYGLLQYFVFNCTKLDKLSQINSESIVVLYREYQQLPQFDILERSIARHYPSDYRFSEQELLFRILGTIDLIGKDVYDGSVIGGRNMVLLGVMRELLDDDSILETSPIEMSSAEINFLKNFSTNT